MNKFENARRQRLIEALIAEQRKDFKHDHGTGEFLKMYAPVKYQEWLKRRSTVH